MKRVSPSARRRRFVRAALLISIVLAIGVYIACSNDSTYAPITPNTPAAKSTVVAGSVTDLTHAAVKDAIVSMEALSNGVPATALWLQDQAVLAKGKNTPATSSSATQRVTTTDASGRFAFDNVPAGEYAIEVRADNHRGGGATVEVPIAPQPLDTIVVDVNLTPTGTFSGVATLENGTDHSDIVVYCKGTSYVGVTEADGSYAISDVPVGSYTIQAMHAHYLSDSTPGTLTYAGENAVLSNLLLKLDNNIPPVAMITVPVQPMGAGAPITFQPSATDADGTVVLYEWDFENDGVIDASSALPSSAMHTFATAGDYVVKLRVTDNEGAIGLAAAKITVTEDAVYMSTTGIDANPGTKVAPVLTLAQAYVRAQNAGVSNIRAGAGTYNQVPVFQAGINVDGGYDPVLWTPGAGYTTFSVGTSRATANNITTATIIAHVEVTTSNQPAAANSIALVSTNSTSALSFTDCIFRASSVSFVAGPATSGTGGVSGGSGSPGNVGACDVSVLAAGGAGGASTVGCTGGAGGKGSYSSQNGVPGQSGLCGGGGGGGGG
ncbi:MAG TPA: PKD domain-containing protein, partial [Candidatus Krumholzibacteria bacterium]|nr:PKD domain-containing protein [Candidatus Krumholzibacteria bacterium]